MRAVLGDLSLLSFYFTATELRFEMKSEVFFHFLCIGGLIMRTKSCLFAILFLFISTGFAKAGFSEDSFLVQAPLVTKNFQQVGVAKIWNGVKDFHVQVNSAAGWELLDVQIYVGQDAPPATKKGDLIPGLFTDVNDGLFASSYELTLDLVDDLGIRWGLNYEGLQTPTVSVHVSMARLDGNGDPLKEVVAVVDEVNVYEIVEEGCWAYNGSGASVEEGTFDEILLADETVKGGYSFDVTLIHPKRGHFIDSPVGGLFAQTPTQSNLTDIDGAFDYFPGETVTLSIGQYSIGSTVADHKISPLD
ncbi:MAG: hypothetical protein KAR01_01375, partial [Desulfocapsa sp.]|nr:hypothetical protein [Desulfocapsa sp.]